MYLIIFVVFLVLGLFVQGRLKSRFREYSKIPIRAGLTGKQVAEAMLYDHGIHDVQVVSVPGMLTDHYNPANKTINLSEEVYRNNSVAAAAVAAHETGHAVQHATAYSFLNLRSTLVPVVSISSKMLNWILIIGMLFTFGAIFNLSSVLLVIITLQGAITLFSLVTLPVEFDASNRALAWLQQRNLTSSEQQSKAENALKWAASTYVVSALAAVTTLLYYVMLFMGSRD